MSKAGGKQSKRLAEILAYSSTLKMEVTSPSETSGDFQRTTRRYIPKDITLQSKIWRGIRLIFWKN
jgi:hypothetical protein